MSNLNHDGVGDNDHQMKELIKKLDRNADRKITQDEIEFTLCLNGVSFPDHYQSAVY